MTRENGTIPGGKEGVQAEAWTKPKLTEYGKVAEVTEGGSYAPLMEDAIYFSGM